MPDVSRDEIIRSLEKDQAVKAAVDAASEAKASVRDLRSEFENKIDRMAHGLVEDLSDRWDDKVKNLKLEIGGEVTQAIKTTLKALLPDFVETELNEIQKREEANAKEAKAAKEAKWNRFFRVFTYLSAVAIFIASIAGVYNAFNGSNTTQETRTISKVADALDVN